MNYLKLIFVELYFIFTTIVCINANYHNAPRFKHSVRFNHYNYLGDSVKFKCLAIGNPMPKVHWYRNDVYLNYSYMHTIKRYKENEQQMSLEIKDIELGDKGEWRCRVWNSEGSITRNFSLHIIDYCDYFFNNNHTPAHIPLECVCQWKMLKIYKQDINYDDISDKICLQFKKLNQNLINHRRPMCLNRPCLPTISYEKIIFNPNPNTTILLKDVDVLNSIIDKNIINNVDTNLLSNVELIEQLRAVSKMSSGPKILEFDAKIEDMRNNNDNNDNDDDDDDENHFNNVEIEINQNYFDTTTTNSIKNDKNNDNNNESDNNDNDYINKINLKTFKKFTKSPLITIETTTRSGWWPGPKRLENLAPYFVQAVYHNTEPIIAPSGRTIKLSCRSHGIPEPHVTWHKDDKELGPDSERYSSSKYHFNGYILEMEDAVESDSGKYICEVYNKHGTIKREFDVRIVDRSRSKPIIVPNILLNQTVDVNSTVNFTCKVISDNLPHFTWAKLLKINGSYINYTDPKHPQFNLIDVQYLPKTKIFRDTRKAVLSIVDVAVTDQGIYSCIVGNSLGISMANATLTVNEFRPKTLPTDPIPQTLEYQFILFVALVFLAIAILIAVFTYWLYQGRQSKNRISNLDNMQVVKKVVITKKQQNDGEIWPDLASSYAITIESVVRKHDIENSSSDYTNKKYEVPTDQKWEIDRKRIEIQNKLGEGAFGEVWQASLYLENTKNNPMPVAVKKLKENAGDKELIILVGEMQIFKSIGEHKNVLKLVGCCTGTGDLYVVLELCPYGNLKSFLKAHRPLDQNNDIEKISLDYIRKESSTDKQEQNSFNGKLKLRDLLRFAAEIARGMEFLASKKIIHRDLAARNVLVAENYVMKISDFGLSRNIFNDHYYRKNDGGNLPVKWMAPESLEEGNRVYTTMSDVWSYGVIVWEIMTLGDQPYPNVKMEDLYRWLMAGNRMDPPSTCPVEIHSVMAHCWQLTPEARPTFKAISEYLEELLNSATQYHDEMPSDASFQPSEAEDDDDKHIYHNSKLLRNRLSKSIAPFDEFINKQEYENLKNVDEDTPLIDNKKPTKTKKKHKVNEPYYCNVQDKSLIDHQKYDIESSNDHVVYHDYVNDQISSKSEESANNASYLRSSHLSDSSAFEIDSANLIYSSPPSKKSSVSNLSMSYHQPQLQLSRCSSKNVLPQRSYSVESQPSSGRGGSSAMSSAEGIGGLADLCQVEYAVINPSIQNKNESSYSNISTVKNKQNQ